MERLLYFIFLGLAVPFILSCQKEKIKPCDIASDYWNPCEAECHSYSFINKANEKVALGEARGDYVLVGFADDVLIEDKQRLLAPFPAFEGVEGESAMDSGVITIVKLKSGTSCFEVEKMIKALEKQKTVSFAAPIFNDPEQIALWVGLTNEFIVTMESDASLTQLEMLADQTRTKIVTLLSDQTYILSADKNSNGNALEMCTIFNAYSFISFADPNLLYQLASLELEASSSRIIYENTDLTE